MKSFGAVALLFLAALVVVPSTSAQAPQGVTLVCPDLAGPIPYAGQAALACEVRVGCADFLTSGGATSGTVSVQSPPAWLTSAPTPVDFDPAACVTDITGGGFVSESVAVPLAAGKDAPGVVDHALTLVAEVAGGSSTDSAIVTVAYHVNYTLVPDVTFPLNVTGDQVSFNVTVTQASNARSMVMMEQLKVTAGTLSGPASEVYENDAGKPVSKTFKFTYKPPTSEWTNATATFTAFGHYLLQDGRAGDFDAGTPMTFTFTSAGEHEHDEEEKESPAPVAPLMLLGLVALALLARRGK